MKIQKIFVKENLHGVGPPRRRANKGRTRRTDCSRINKDVLYLRTPSSHICCYSCCILYVHVYNVIYLISI